MTRNRRTKLARMALAKESPNEARVALSMLMEAYMADASAWAVGIWEWAVGPGYQPPLDRVVHLAVGSNAPYIASPQMDELPLGQGL